MEKFNISIVLPIKSSKTIQFEDYFTKAITSIKEQVVQPEEIVIVHTDETKLVEYLDSFDFGDLVVKKLIWKEEPNFCAQVNYGVQNSNSDWVSIFEFDDEY